MGLPRFWGRVTNGSDDIIGTDIGGGKRSEDAVKSKGKLGIAWTVAYYTLLVVGLVGWSKLLWPLTESGSALAKF